jgi:NAD-dependent deacetylase
MEETFAQARPGRGHRALASLYRAGKSPAVITQNIDNLHQASGFAATDVIELHGNTTYATCLSCATRHEIADIHAAFAQTDEVPDCRACGGLLKTATISFGQSMPEGPMLRAQQAVQEADLCLVLGSSLVVYPAAGFPEMAKRRGAGLVILNRQETGLDPIANLVIHAGIGDVLGGAVGVN